MIIINKSKPEVELAAGSGPDDKAAILHVAGQLTGPHGAQGTARPHRARQLTSSDKGGTTLASWSAYCDLLCIPRPLPLGWKHINCPFY
jgi:hypothetical protein